MKNSLTKIAAIIVFLLIGKASFSQVTFNHALGFSAYNAMSMTKGGGSGWGVTYSPRLNLIDLADECTISVGTHLGLGVSGTGNSRSGEGKFSFLLDAPIVAEINFGHGANPDASSSSFGGFAGVGFGYNKMTYSDNTGLFATSGNLNSSGLLINGGVRGIIKDQSVGLRVAYLLNSSNDGVDVLTVGAFYTFGMD